jgi:AcrR family transcriptional regulator
MEGIELRRRERERLRRREEIFNAAISLFSEKGYHDVTMQEIAKRAEFSVGTLYKFFRNKEDLYRALMLEQADKFHNTLLKAISEDEDEIEKLRNYVKVKGEVFKANLSIVRLYFAETRGASFNIRAGLDREIRLKYQHFLKNLSMVFQSGMERNLFRRIADPFYLALAIDSITNAFLFLWMEDQENHPYPEDPDIILNIIFKGLLSPAQNNSNT